MKSDKRGATPFKRVYGEGDKACVVGQRLFQLATGNKVAERERERAKSVLEAAES